MAKIGNFNSFQVFFATAPLDHDLKLVEKRASMTAGLPGKSRNARAPSPGNSSAAACTLHFASTIHPTSVHAYSLTARKALQQSMRSARSAAAPLRSRTPPGLRSVGAWPRVITALAPARPCCRPALAPRPQRASSQTSSSLRQTTLAGFRPYPCSRQRLARTKMLPFKAPAVQTLGTEPRLRQRNTASRLFRAGDAVQAPEPQAGQPGTRTLPGAPRGRRDGCGALRRRVTSQHRRAALPPPRLLGAGALLGRRRLREHSTRVAAERSNPGAFT